jgi:hypothetical protein
MAQHLPFLARPSLTLAAAVVRHMLQAQAAQAEPAAEALQTIRQKVARLILAGAVQALMLQAHQILAQAAPVS